MPNEAVELLKQKIDEGLDNCTFADLKEIVKFHTFMMEFKKMKDDEQSATLKKLHSKLSVEGRGMVTLTLACRAGLS